MKKAIRIVVVYLSVYILLSVSLVLAESASPESDIRSFNDAIWYSLSAMTTASFSEVSPVTSTGKCISLIFPVLGIAIIAAVIIGSIRFFSSDLYPRLKLERASHRYGTELGFLKRRLHMKLASRASQYRNGKRDLASRTSTTP